MTSEIKATSMVESNPPLNITMIDINFSSLCLICGMLRTLFDTAAIRSSLICLFLNSLSYDELIYLVNLNIEGFNFHLLQIKVSSNSDKAISEFGGSSKELAFESLTDEKSNSFELNDCCSIKLRFAHRSR